MWQVFKEAIWDYTYGKVYVMATFAATAVKLAISISLPLNQTMPDYTQKDSTFWLILLVAFLVGMLLFLLRRTFSYKEALEGRDNIRILY